MSKSKTKTAYSLAIVLALVLVGTAASAQAEIVDVTVTAYVSPGPGDCGLFGQTEGSATVSFRLDTSDPIVIPAGTLIGPFETDYFLTDLYGFQPSALSAISASYGNKTWNAAAVSVGPFGGYPPNPSAAVWFNGPVTAGGNAIPSILFEDSDGRLQSAGAACGWADLGGACAFMDRMDIWDETMWCFGISGPLQVEVVSSGTVVIDGCNSGVPDTLLPSGGTISDRITACADGARNHGQFMSCVSRVTDGLKADGVITGPQKDAIQRCAAKAEIP